MVTTERAIPLRCAGTQRCTKAATGTQQAALPKPAREKKRVACHTEAARAMRAAPAARIRVKRVKMKRLS
jgi:hypothetical protein